MITTLRSAVEASVGSRISGASITIPHLPALYEEDLHDALQYAGLAYLDGRPYWCSGVLYETTAAYATANGFGRCTNYTHLSGCRVDEYALPNDEILAISYTRTALTATMALGGGGFAVPASEGPLAVELTLGHDARHDSPQEEYYWTRVQDAIRRPVVEANLSMARRPVKVLVHGECADEPMFQWVLNGALDRVLKTKLPRFSHDPVFSAARAAAEKAKRISYRYRQNATGVGDPSIDL
jgi:hypothetical protein